MTELMREFGRAKSLSDPLIRDGIKARGPVEVVDDREGGKLGVFEADGVRFSERLPPEEGIDPVTGSLRVTVRPGPDKPKPLGTGGPDAPTARPATQQPRTGASPSQRARETIAGIDTPPAAEFDLEAFAKEQFEDVKTQGEFVNAVSGGLTQGIAKAVVEGGRFLGVLSDEDVAQFDEAIAAFQPTAPAQRVTAKVAEVGGQFVVPGGAGFKLLLVAGASPLVAAMVADAGVFGMLDDPDAPDIANLIPEDSETFGALRELLAVEPDAPDWENRVRKATEAALVGGIAVKTIEGVIAAIRAAKAAVAKLGGSSAGQKFKATIEDKLIQAGEGAEGRLAGREGLTMLSAGVDLTPMGDRLVAAVGRKVAAAKTGRAPVFFSPAAEAVAAKPFEKGMAQQWLKGLKKEEVKFIGLREFLEAKTGSIAKQEVLDYLDANQVQVQELVRGGRTQRFDTVEEFQDAVLQAESRQNFDFAAQLTREQEALAGIDPDGPGTKFATYTLPGGENYRELLITLPERAASRRAELEVIARSTVGLAPAEFEELQGIGRAEERESFTGGHFDDPNVLLHVRFNERTDADGKRILFIEEIQSDWHQRGRKQGYTQPELVGKIEVFETITARIRGTFNTEQEAQQFIRTQPDRGGLDFDLHGQGALSGGSVPDAPFKKTWPELGLKRMIRWAADNDFDAVAWTTGAQQAERYDLSKQISRVTLSNASGGIGRADTGPFKRGQLTAFDLNGGPVIERFVHDPNEVAELIGKDAADKLLAADGIAGHSAGVGVFTQQISGLDLKVGGDGMKRFYDRMLPQMANKLGKKFGAKVGEADFGMPTARQEDFDRLSQIADESEMTFRTLSTELRTGGLDAGDIGVDQDEFARLVVAAQGGREGADTFTTHTFPITPALKDEALKNGLPLFSAGVGAGLAADQIDVETPEIFLGPPLLQDEGDAVEQADPVQVAGAGAILKAIRSGGRAATAATAQAEKLAPLAGRQGGVMRVRPATEQEASNFLSKIGIDGSKIPVEMDIANIATVEDLERARQAMMDELKPQITAERRGVIKNVATLQMAEQLDILPRVLTRRIGEAFNAEEITATRMLLEQSRNELDELALRIRGSLANEREAFEFRRRMALHAVIQMQFLGARAEIGRALQAFKIDISGGTAATDARISELLNEFGGLKTAKQMAERWLQINDPAQRNKLAFRGAFVRTRDAFFEVWINGLLSGPMTHVRNVTGNTLFQMWSIPELTVSALIGEARSAVSVARGQGPITDRNFLGEIAARSYGVTQGLKDGWVAAAKAFRAGQPADPIGKIESLRHRAISAEAFNMVGPAGKMVDVIGSTVRIPGTFLMGMDEFYKGIAGRMEGYQIAYQRAVQARINGATEKEAADIAFETLRNPPPGVASDTLDAQRYYTFTDEPLGRVNDMVMAWQRIPMVGRIVMPFRRTPINLAKRFVERTPLAIAMPSVRKALAAGGAERDMALARIALGTGVMLVASSFAADGLLTGNGPEDPKQRRALRGTGWQPWSFKIKKGEGWISNTTLEVLKSINAVSEDKDHIYVSYLGIEPVGNWLAAAAGATDAMKWSTEYDQNANLAEALVGGFIESQTDRSFFTGFANLAEAMVYGPGAFNRYIARTASSMKPFSSLLRTTNRAFDRTLRDTRPDPDLPLGVSQFQAFLRGWKNGVPGLSTTLPARRNIIDGQEIKPGQGNWFDYVNPFYISVRKYSPVEIEMVRLGVPFSAPGRNIAGVKLTPQQYDRFVQLIGAEVSINGVTHKEALQGLIDSDFYNGVGHTDDQKARDARNVHQDYVNGAMLRLAGLRRVHRGGRVILNVDIGEAEDVDLALKVQQAADDREEKPARQLPSF